MEIVRDSNCDDGQMHKWQPATLNQIVAQTQQLAKTKLIYLWEATENQCNIIMKDLINYLIKSSTPKFVTIMKR